LSGFFNRSDGLNRQVSGLIPVAEIDRRLAGSGRYGPGRLEVSLYIGAYIELHQPLGPVPLEYQGAAVPKRMNKLGSAGSPGTGSLLTADPIAEHEALVEAEHASERKALTALREHQV
jgi:hypothetical protein